MNLSLEHIEQAMRSGAPFPEDVPDYLAFLAALYAQRSRELEQVLIGRGAAWLRIREAKTTDLQADREWEATGKGIREMQLTMELHRIDQLTIALTSSQTVGNRPDAPPIP